MRNQNSSYIPAVITQWVGSLLFHPLTCGRILLTMIRFLKGRARSFACAFKGIALMWGAGANMRIHFFAATTAIGTGFYFKITPLEWCLIILCCVIVIATEGLNTALERLADRVHPDRHPEIGKAKDLAAGATLIVAIGASVVGIIIFAKYITALLA